MDNNAGIEPATKRLLVFCSTIELIVNCPSRRARPTVPLSFGQPNAARLLPGLMPQVSNGLPDSGRPYGRPLPINCSQALSGKRVPRTCELPFILSCRCLRRDSAGCYSRPWSQHLPSTREASPTFQHSSAVCKTTKLTGLGLPGCPQTRFEAESPGGLPFSLPFNRII